MGQHPGALGTVRGLRVWGQSALWVAPARSLPGPGVLGSGGPTGNAIHVPSDPGSPPWGVSGKQEKPGLFKGVAGPGHWDPSSEGMCPRELDGVPGVGVEGGKPSGS